ncbi:hypothetical protein [Candidatus Aalborgicola defluviihabitans]|uniref:hypothetical protein n=1 Tax=Candidatus Aalborgicola defluviihabitans TaxID=3386187 RepID=UPI0039B8E253
MRPSGTVQLKVYDGHRLHARRECGPVACLAVFHHVKVQLATLRDLARVLRPWGRIAMVDLAPITRKRPNRWPRWRSSR